MFISAFNSFGGPALILHNATQKEVERLAVDTETIELKIGSHFETQTGRANSLETFCKQLDNNYPNLLNHAPTRWITLNLVLQRMIELSQPLKAHFLLLKQPLKILDDFFQTRRVTDHRIILPLSPLVLQATTFISIKDSCTFFGLAEITELFKYKILQRQRSGFSDYLQLNY